MNGRNRDAVAAAIIFLALLGMYLGTAAPAVLFEDTGEFASGASVLGVAHPPGYPLYLLLGHLWARLPVSEPGFALACFSAAAAAAGCAVLFAACRALGLGRAAAVAAALAFGATRTLWAQAVIPEVYGLTVLLTGASILVITLLVMRREQRLLPAALILLALCFLNHYIAFFTLAPAVALCVLRLRDREDPWRAPVWSEIACAAAGVAAWCVIMIFLFGPLMGLKPVWRYIVAGAGAAPAAFAASLLPSVRLRVRAPVIAAGALAFAACLCVLLYIPLRAVLIPELNWGNHTETFTGFAELLRRSQFAAWENQLAWFHWPTKWSYFMLFIKGLPAEFSPAFVFFGLLGALLTAMERRRVFLFLAYLLAVQTVGIILFINFHFALHQIYVFKVFFIGAHLVCALFMAFGTEGLLKRVREAGGGAAWANAAGAALVLLCLWPIAQNLPFNSWQNETRPVRFALDNLRVIRRDGLYFMHGSITVPVVGYAHTARGLRRDILLIDNHGTAVKKNYELIGHEFSFVNMSQIVHDATVKNLPARRVYSTGELFPEMNGFDTYNLGPLFEVGRARGCDLGLWEGPQGDYSSAGRTRDFNTDTLEVLIAANWAQCDFVRENNRTALLRLTRVADRMEGSALISVMIGSLLLRYDSTSSAEEMFKKAISFCPTYSQAYAKLGDVYMQRGELDKAKDNYRNALALTPNKLDAMLNLANLYQQSYEYAKALTMYRDILKLQPDASTAYNNMALTYDLMGREAEAESAYKKAIELSPNMALYYNGLGAHYLKYGRFYDAIVALEKHLEMQPDSVMGLYNLGLVYEGKGDYPEAAEFFARAARQRIHGTLAQGIALASLERYNAICVDAAICLDDAEKFFKTLAGESNDIKVAHNAKLYADKLEQENAPAAAPANSSSEIQNKQM